MRSGTACKRAKKKNNSVLEHEALISTNAISFILGLLKGVRVFKRTINALHDGTKMAELRKEEFFALVRKRPLSLFH